VTPQREPLRVSRFARGIGCYVERAGWLTKCDAYLQTSESFRPNRSQSSTDVGGNTLCRQRGWRLKTENLANSLCKEPERELRSKVAVRISSREARHPVILSRWANRAQPLELTPDSRWEPIDTSIPSHLRSRPPVNPVLREGSTVEPMVDAAALASFDERPGDRAHQGAER
jgi:hypothetical protein